MYKNEIEFIEKLKKCIQKVYDVELINPNIQNRLCFERKIGSNSTLTIDVEIYSDAVDISVIKELHTPLINRIFEISTTPIMEDIEINEELNKRIMYFIEDFMVKTNNHIKIFKQKLFKEIEDESSYFLKYC